MPPVAVRRAAALLAALLLPGGAVAQPDVTKLPKRPPLAAGLDTNSSGNYYNLAIEKLKEDPTRATDALYWAARLDPSSADALYARRLAFMLSNPRRTFKYYDGDRKVVRDPEVMAMDSLLGRAQMMNPFTVRGLDRIYLIELYKQEVLRATRQGAAGTRPSEWEIEYHVRQYFATGDVESRA